MTVAAEDPRKEFAGNGVTVAFTIAKVYDEDHVVAYLVEDADPTNVTTWALTTDFTVSNVGSANATLTAVVAPPTGYTLVTDRVVPNVQDHDYTTNDDFPAESHERALDLLTMQVQELDSRLDRAFRFPTEDISGASLEVPAPEADSVLAWSSDGTYLVNVAVGSVALAIPADGSVTLAKMDDIAQYQIYTRTTAGTGDPEMFQATAAGLALLDDANAAAQRTTLGLGTIATQAASGVSITGGTIGASVTLAGLTQAAIYALLPAGSQVGYSRDFDATRTDITAASISDKFEADSSTPLIGEGTDLGLLVAHAAATTTNKLIITVDIAGACSGVSADRGLALFAGSTCIGACSMSEDDDPKTMVVEHTPGSTSSVNYTVRVSLSSGTFLLNQNGDGNDFGATHGSSITIVEVKAS